MPRGFSVEFQRKNTILGHVVTDFGELLSQHYPVLKPAWLVHLWTWAVTVRVEERKGGPRLQT